MRGRSEVQEDHGFPFHNAPGRFLFTQALGSNGESKLLGFANPLLQSLNNVGGIDRGMSWHRAYGHWKSFSHNEIERLKLARLKGILTAIHLSSPGVVITRVERGNLCGIALAVCSRLDLTDDTSNVPSTDSWCGLRSYHLPFGFK